MSEPMFKIKEETSTNDYGEFSIEPLEPGFGHTVGNALRRVLLTSIEGSAITSVKISGVKHKFSSVSGVKENVVDIILNVKQLSVRLLDGKESATIKLSVKGPKEVTAGDLDLPENVEIVDKDQYICSLSDKKAKLDMELTVEKGAGYTLAEEKRVESLGVIPTDAIFTPIKRVNYSVEATRVGRQTNLDKLVLQIWTNGTVDPKVALENAARILAAYFLQVFDPKSKATSSVDATATHAGVSEGVLKMTVDELDLPTRIYNSLRNGGIETLGHLLQTPRKELMGMRNMGAKSLTIIEEKLQEKGISLSV